MIESQILTAMEEGAVQILDGKVSVMNAAVLRMFPALKLGEVPPEAIASLAGSAFNSAAMTILGAPCIVQRMVMEDGVLLLFRPEVIERVTPRQIEGFLFQLRQQMSDMAVSMDGMSEYWEDATPPPQVASMNRTFYRMSRMVENIEFLENDTPAFCPMTMDIAGLCRQLCAEVAPLLAACGVRVNYRSELVSLLVVADAELLRQMLLGVISNSARSAMGGDITLKLYRYGERAMIQVMDSGVLNEKSDLASVLEGHTRSPIPAPGEGAGIGLPVVRRILNLHNGTIMVDRSESGGLNTTIAIPIKPVMTTLQAHAPSMDRNGGRNPILVALADVLPDCFYSPKDLGL